MRGTSGQFVPKRQDFCQGLYMCLNGPIEIPSPLRCEIISVSDVLGFWLQLSNGPVVNIYFQFPWLICFIYVAQYTSGQALIQDIPSVILASPHCCAMGFKMAYFSPISSIQVSFHPGWFF